MSSLTGARGSTRRRLVVCGTFVLGLAVLLLAGAMMETPVKQVYWAVYSRLHPMRDGTETYGEPAATLQAACLWVLTSMPCFLSFWADTVVFVLQRSPAGKQTEGETLSHPSQRSTRKCLDWSLTELTRAQLQLRL